MPHNAQFRLNETKDAYVSAKDHIESLVDELKETKEMKEAIVHMLNLRIITLRDKIQEARNALDELLFEALRKQLREEFFM